MDLLVSAIHVVSASYFLCFSRELDWHFLLQAASGSAPSADKSNVSKEEEKSETYSHNMTEAMGAGMFNIFCSSSSTMM